MGRAPLCVRLPTLLSFFSSTEPACRQKRKCVHIIIISAGLLWESSYDKLTRWHTVVVKRSSFKSTADSV